MRIIHRQPNRAKRAINELYSELDCLNPAGEDYPKVVDQIVKLTELQNKKKLSVSPDVVLTVAGNLAAVLIVVKYEQLNVIATKAFQIVKVFR